MKRTRVHRTGVGRAVLALVATAAVVGPAGAQDARDARDYAIREPPVYALGREWVVEMLEAAGLPPTEAGVVEMLPVSAGIPGAQGATSGYVT